jgi:hypothetical protein
MGYITPSGPLMTPLPYLLPSSGNGIPDPGIPELGGGTAVYSCRAVVPCKSCLVSTRRAYPTGTLALSATYGPFFPSRCLSII